eukprot:198285-Prorocentrum_minimum.AAC.1
MAAGLSASLSEVRPGACVRMCVADVERRVWVGGRGREGGGGAAGGSESAPPTKAQVAPSRRKSIGLGIRVMGDALPKMCRVAGIGLGHLRSGVQSDGGRCAA